MTVLADKADTYCKEGFIIKKKLNRMNFSSMNIFMEKIYIIFTRNRTQSTSEQSA